MIATTDLQSAIRALSAKQPPVRAPLFSPHDEERQARFGHILPLMASGDLLLYSGSMLNPISASNRIFCYSQFSHAAMVVADDHGADIIDICCKTGCSRHSLAEAVMANPGRWYYAPVNRDAFPKFDGDAAVKAATAMLGDGYGYSGIFFQWMMRTPGARELCFATGLEKKAWFSTHKFCSFGVDLWAMAGGEDPCPGRQPQLCTPQDIAQSKLWIHPKTPLIP